MGYSADMCDRVVEGWQGIANSECRCEPAKCGSNATISAESHGGVRNDRDTLT